MGGTDFLHKWKMKDGSEINVCDMSDSHLANAIALVQRQEEDLGFFENIFGCDSPGYSFLSMLTNEMNVRHSINAHLKRIGRRKDQHD